MIKGNVLSFSNIRIVFLFSVIFVFFTSCKKEEIVLIDNNIAQPDNTVENVTVENYVNKLHIALLGRKPTEVEFDASLVILKDDDLSLNSRINVIQSIHDQVQYYDNEFAIMRSNFLNNADSAEFAEAKWVIEFAKSATSNQIEIDFWNAELLRIEPLISLESDLSLKTKSIKEAHEVVVNNMVYDEINMGTENFVVSLFQNFLLRYPTQAELDGGKNMVDGKSDALFTLIGNNKNELLSIFFNNNEYYEGQVRANYLRFLYREPSADEISLLVTQYKSTGNYKEIQSYILSTDEYLGIQ